MMLAFHLGKPKPTRQVMSRCLLQAPVGSERHFRMKAEKGPGSFAPARTNDPKAICDHREQPHAGQICVLATEAFSSDHVSGGWESAYVA